jgi:hypothetical protein
MEVLTKILPFIIPVALIQLVLMIVALLDLVKREKTRGPKWVWLLVILLGEILGPIIYLVFGRVDEG